ncbi:hypothetical protein [Burkholderia ubonensis]|uniref:hypothetical protein n=1 Tax=Burkholderia ubonensis TaxID=101571 RepID=UPI0012F74ACF|nr:hypothetical protein [Burkholderia ubonensis]
MNSGIGQTNITASRARTRPAAVEDASQYAEKTPLLWRENRMPSPPAFLHGQGVDRIAEHSCRCGNAMRLAFAERLHMGR